MACLTDEASARWRRVFYRRSLHHSILEKRHIFTARRRLRTVGAQWPVGVARESAAKSRGENFLFSVCAAPRRNGIRLLDYRLGAAPTTHA